MGRCRKYIFNAFNELVGRHQNQNIKVEEKSGLNKPKILVELTKIISNPSKDTVCSPKGGFIFKSQVHC